MPQKLPNINCQYYCDGNCRNNAAPRRWIGKPQCVLLDAPKDPRTKPGCALQYEFPRPDAPLRPPPARAIREGVSCDTLIASNEVLTGILTGIPESAEWTVDVHRALELLGSIFFCGDFVAETRNEQELEMLMRKHGYFIETQAQFDAYCRTAHEPKTGFTGPNPKT